VQQTKRKIDLVEKKPIKKKKPKIVGYVLYKKFGKKYKSKSILHEENRVCLSVRSIKLCVDRKDIKKIEEIKH